MFDQFSRKFTGPAVLLTDTGVVGLGRISATRQKPDCRPITIRGHRRFICPPDKYDAQVIKQRIKLGLPPLPSSWRGSPKLADPDFLDKLTKQALREMRAARTRRRNKRGRGRGRKKRSSSRGGTRKRRSKRSRVLVLNCTPVQTRRRKKTKPGTRKKRQTRKNTQQRRKQSPRTNRRRYQRKTAWARVVDRGPKGGPRAWSQYRASQSTKMLPARSVPLLMAENPRD